MNFGISITTRLESFTRLESNVLLGTTSGIKYEWTDSNGISVATLTTFNWWDGKNICNLFVSPQYRKMGYARELLDFATKSLGCTCLSVDKCNLVAKKIYDKYGFKVTYKDDRLFYMSLSEEQQN